MIASHFSLLVISDDSESDSVDDSEDDSVDDSDEEVLVFVSYKLYDSGSVSELESVVPDELRFSLVLKSGTGRFFLK